MNDVDDRPAALLPVAVSSLNQYLFCPRRCALIHVEGLFTENAATLQGRFLHDAVDVPEVERRPGVRIVRALPLFSRRLGLVGKADVVEFHPPTKDGDPEVPWPVEYKRGPRRQWDNDDAQICAQALCLEEMLETRIHVGAIYHAKSKHRREVEFTPELRQLTENAVAAIRGILQSRCVPPAALHPKCDGCSLRGVCLPEVTKDAQAVRDYMVGLTRDV